MTKIMFVCHGNICRSPMAEFVLKDLLKKKNLQDKYLVQSSATSTEEIWGDIGNPVYPPAREELKKHGIDCSGKHAVQVTRDDYQKYDLLVVMDSNNVRNLTRIIGSDPEGKVHKLLSFAGRSDDVSDPWYTRDFATCYNDIFEGCEALLKKLEGGKYND